MRTAEAAVITARGRPNPSVAAGAGWTNAPESPLVFHFEPALTLETAGKRAHRILQAQKVAEAAGLELAETVWHVRSRLRAALADRVFAARAVESAREEADIRAEIAAMLDKRLSVGEIARPIADAARIESTTASIAVKAAEGAAQEARVALAAAAGLATASLDGIALTPPPDPPGDVRAETAQKSGLLHRIDVRRALLEYAAAEAGLQLEVARQYPDIQVGPGYSFDEGHHKIAIGPSLALPVLNRNRGPIAEAEGRRQEAEARFTAVQAQAIVELDTAQARYRAALSELDEARRRAGLAAERERAVRRAFDAGEEDRLALAGARLESALIRRQSIEALKKAQLALGSLEDAVQQPLPPERKTP